MSVQLLTEHHLEFLSLKGSCTGSSESIPVKMPHCWKSHVQLNYTQDRFSPDKADIHLTFSGQSIVQYLSRDM